jgi:hypothetical protein
MPEHWIRKRPGTGTGTGTFTGDPPFVAIVDTHAANPTPEARLRSPIPEARHR